MKKNESYQSNKGINERHEQILETDGTFAAAIYERCHCMTKFNIRRGFNRDQLYDAIRNAFRMNNSDGSKHLTCDLFTSVKSDFVIRGMGVSGGDMHLVTRIFDEVYHSLGMEWHKEIGWDFYTFPEIQIINWKFDSYMVRVSRMLGAEKPVLVFDDYEDLANRKYSINIIWDILRPFMQYPNKEYEKIKDKCLEGKFESNNIFPAWDIYSGIYEGSLTGDLLDEKLGVMLRQLNVHDVSDYAVFKITTMMFLRGEMDFFKAGKDDVTQTHIYQYFDFDHEDHRQMVLDQEKKVVDRYRECMAYNRDQLKNPDEKGVFAPGNEQKHDDKIDPAVHGWIAMQKESEQQEAKIEPVRAASWRSSKRSDDDQVTITGPDGKKKIFKDHIDPEMVVVDQNGKEHRVINHEIISPKDSPFKKAGNPSIINDMKEVIRLSGITPDNSYKEHMDDKVPIDLEISYLSNVLQLCMMHICYDAFNTESEWRKYPSHPATLYEGDLGIESDWSTGCKCRQHIVNAFTYLLENRYDHICTQPLIYEAVKEAVRLMRIWNRMFVIDESRGLIHFFYIDENIRVTEIKNKAKKNN